MGSYQKATDLQRKLRGSVSKDLLVTHKKRLLKLLVVIIVLGGAGYGAYRWINRPTADKQQTDHALLDATKTGNTDATIAKLQQAYDDAATAEGKAQSAYYLAAHYTVKKDHKNALKYYRAADDFYQSKNIDVVLGIANEAAALNSKDLARTYYQKAIDYYQPLATQDSTYQGLIDQFKARLDEPNQK